MVARTHCSVGGCRRYRTIKDQLPDGYRWVMMCRDHWRRVPKSRRRALARISRLRSRFGDSPELVNRWSRVWAQLTATAARMPPAEITEIIG